MFLNNIFFWTCPTTSLVATQPASQKRAGLDRLWLQQVVQQLALQCWLRPLLHVKRDAVSLTIICSKAITHFKSSWILLVSVFCKELQLQCKRQITLVNNWSATELTSDGYVDLFSQGWTLAQLDDCSKLSTSRTMFKSSKKPTRTKRIRKNCFKLQRGLQT